MGPNVRMVYLGKYYRTLDWWSQNNEKQSSGDAIAEF